MNHAEVLVCLAQYFLARMRLEAKQDFEERGCRRRSPAGNVKQVSAGRDHSREFRHAFIKRDIFERAARNHQIERVVGEGKRQEISFGKRDVARASGTLGNCFSGGGN